MLASHYLAAYRANPSGEEADALAAQARVALRAAAERATALHAPVGALDYLEQALEVTIDPVEQAALHERAAAAAATAARIQVGDEHGRRPPSSTPLTAIAWVCCGVGRCGRA